MRDIKTFSMPGLANGPNHLALEVGPGSRIATHADVVVDLETLGRAPGCQVLEIGAAVLMPDGEVRRFSSHPNLFDQKQLGLDVDPATLLWWLEESQHSARVAVLRGHPEEGIDTKSLISVLLEFGRWLEALGDREVRVWGNGASFDLGILGALYDAADTKRPWKFWAERDLRTLFEFKGKMVLDRQEGSQHVGWLDAVHELAQLHIALNQEK